MAVCRGVAVARKLSAHNRSALNELSTRKPLYRRCSRTWGDVPPHSADQHPKRPEKLFFTFNHRAPPFVGTPTRRWGRSRQNPQPSFSKSAAGAPAAEVGRNAAVRSSTGRRRSSVAQFFESEIPILFPVRWSPDKKNAYLGSLKLSEITRDGVLRWRYVHRMDHLVCFLPGLLTLAYARWPKVPSVKQSSLSFAQKPSPKTKNLVGANQPGSSFSQIVTHEGVSSPPQQPPLQADRPDGGSDSHVGDEPSQTEDQPDPKWLRLAGGLMRTCVAMYTHAASGLAPEYMNFDAEHDRLMMPVRGDTPGFISNLRPETLESLYIMDHFLGRRCERGLVMFGAEEEVPIPDAGFVQPTDDCRRPSWFQEAGWRIFTALRKHAKGEYGYSALNVNSLQRKDSQESYFVAETIKYAYLLFAPRDTLDLERWVLSTEAHPFRVRTDVAVQKAESVSSRNGTAFQVDLKTARPGIAKATPVEAEEKGFGKKTHLFYPSLWSSEGDDSPGLRSASGRNVLGASMVLDLRSMRREMRRKDGENPPR